MFVALRLVRALPLDVFAWMVWARSGAPFVSKQDSRKKKDSCSPYQQRGSCAGRWGGHCIRLRSDKHLAARSHDEASSGVPSAAGRSDYSSVVLWSLSVPPMVVSDTPLPPSIALSASPCVCVCVCIYVNQPCSFFRGLFCEERLSKHNRALRTVNTLTRTNLAAIFPSCCSAIFAVSSRSACPELWNHLQTCKQEYYMHKTQSFHHTKYHLINVLRNRRKNQQSSERHLLHFRILAKKCKILEISFQDFS